jgi:hypothetical protein
VKTSKKRRQPSANWLTMFRYRPLVEKLEERLPPGSLLGPMDSFLAQLVNAQTAGGTVGGASVGGFTGGSGINQGLTISEGTSPSPLAPVMNGAVGGGSSSAPAPVGTPNQTSGGGSSINPGNASTGGGFSSAAGGIGHSAGGTGFGSFSLVGNGGSSGGEFIAPPGSLVSGGAGSSSSDLTQFSAFSQSHSSSSSGGSSTGGGSPLAPAPRNCQTVLGPPKIVVPPGTDVNVSAINPAGDYREMSIAVNPRNPQNLIAISTNLNSPNTFFGGDVEIFFSTDGGANWTRRTSQFLGPWDDIPNILGDPQLNPSQPVFLLDRFDPDVTFDDNGVAYVSYIAEYTQQNPPQNPPDPGQTHTMVLVARSLNGGANWGVATVRHDFENFFFNDKDLLGVGPVSASTGTQQVFVTWTQFAGSANSNAPPAQIVISGSNTGVAFSKKAQVAVGGQESEPAVGPNGELYVAWWDFGILLVRKGSFVANTFNFGPIRAVTTLRNTQQAPVLPPQPVRGAVHEPFLVVDRSRSINRGTLYITYMDDSTTNPNPDTDVYLTASSDGGQTWSRPSRINNDNTVNSQFQPRLAIDQTTGVVGIQWEDPREDFTDGQVNIFSAFTNDAGRTFSVNEQMSDNPSDFSQTADPNDFLEYQGAAFINNTFYAIWADNSNNLDGPTRLFFDKETIEPGLITTGSTGNGANHARFEPNDSSTHPFNLGTITPPFFLYGLAITPTDNVDWWKFKFSFTDPCMEINELVGVGSLFMRLYVQNPNGSLTQIGQSSNPGSGATQDIVFSVTSTSQVYFLQVYGFNHSVGDYRLAFLP